MAETSVLLVLAVVLMFARQQLVSGFSIPAMTAPYTAVVSVVPAVCAVAERGRIPTVAFRGCLRGAPGLPVQTVDCCVQPTMPAYPMRRKALPVA